MTSVHDPVALIIGGASGIGRALALALGRAATHVVVGDLDLDGAERTAREVTAVGGSALAVQMDVTQADQVREVVEDVVRARGRLDYLFNSAGLGIWGEAQEVTLAQWRQVLEVNLWGVIHATAAAYPAMVRQGGGHIVNIASLAGLVGAPVVTPYATAKHAVVGLSLSLRAEAAALGVKVTVVCPGPVRSRFHDSLLSAAPGRPTRRCPPGAMTAEAAAAEILRGVRANRAVIVFPWRARLTWWLSRLAPAALGAIGRRAMARVRAAARSPSGPGRPEG